MPASTEGCPYDAVSRAARCESCYEQSGALPPCVKNWLSTRLMQAEPVVLRKLEAVERRAA